MVQSLFIYPLKSAKGIELKEFNIRDKGPAFDREWMLINKHNKFVSQRTHPKMCLIETHLSEKTLTVSAPGMSPLQIGFDRKDSEPTVVSIFEKETSAEFVSKKYDQWFSEFLKQEVQLVRTPQGNTRTTSGNHGPKTPVGFADGYPLLLANLATLKVLSDRLGKEIPMDRFRPNIVINGAAADQEDSWKDLKIGELKFFSAKACSRCAIIDVDPSDASQSKDVSRELKKYRTKNNSILFGMNLIHLETGKISVGDSITPIE